MDRYAVPIVGASHAGAQAAIALERVNAGCDYVQGRPLVLGGSSPHSARIADPAQVLKELA